MSIAIARSLAAPAAAPAPAASGTDGTTPADPKIAEAAKGMEGVFLSMLVDEMFKGTDLAGGQSGYSGLITQHMGDALADSGGFGLAAILTRQMGGTA